MDLPRTEKPADPHLPERTPGLPIQVLPALPADVQQSRLPTVPQPSRELVEILVTYAIRAQKAAATAQGLMAHVIRVLEHWQPSDGSILNEHTI